MAKEYDFVVIGGGHNGLIATAYLARAGFKVACLEANDEFGGGTRSGEVTAPGYVTDMGAMIHNMISRTPLIKNDELGLMSKYGLKYNCTQALFGSIFPDNTHLVIDPSIDQTCENIAQFSQHDAEAYREFQQYFTGMLAVAGVGAQSAPPPYGTMHNAMYKSPQGREFQRVLASSAQQIVEEWFESEQVRTTFTRWCTEMMIDPRAIGTAGLLYFCGTVHDPENPGSPYPVGGNDCFVNALTACCEDAGADLYLNHAVTDVSLENSEAKYVRTANEEFVVKNAVISTINVKLLYQFLGDDAPAAEARHIQRLKHADFSAFNMSFALDTIPEFKCGDGIKKAYCIEVEPWEEEYLMDFAAMPLGHCATNMPTITIPSLLDSTRVPIEGHSLVNIYHYAPYALDGDAQNWLKRKDEIGKEMWDFAKTLWTNVSDDNIVGKWVFSPLDYEQWDPSMVHGDIGQIGLQPSQYYDMRPLPGCGHEYHGEIDNLYVIGCSAHPGAGVAASARPGVIKILEDYGINYKDAINK